MTVVTHAHSLYYGNDGELLSGWASLAKGFALIRNNQNIKEELPTLLQGLPKNFLNEKILDSELKRRKHLLLFGLIMLKNQPLPLFEGDTMRSNNQDFDANSLIIYIQAEEDDDDDDDDIEDIEIVTSADGKTLHVIPIKRRYPITPIPPRKPHYA